MRKNRKCGYLPMKNTEIKMWRIFNKSLWITVNFPWNTKIHINLYRNLQYATKGNK